jgi:hypothetical protein
MTWLQVTARPTGPASHAFQQDQQQHPSDGASGQQGRLTAALGTMWAHAVNLRLLMERQGQRRFLKVGTVY